jgi:hypothetical protein
MTSSLGLGEPRLARLKVPAASCGYLQLKGGFKKSLLMPGEVGSLAGDREFRMSDPHRLTPRRQDFRPTHAASYPSNYCGCMPWCALLVGDRRRRESVTVD